MNVTEQLATCRANYDAEVAILQKKLETKEFESKDLQSSVEDLNKNYEKLRDNMDYNTRLLTAEHKQYKESTHLEIQGYQRKIYNLNKRHVDLKRKVEEMRTEGSDTAVKGSSEDSEDSDNTKFEITQKGQFRDLAADVQWVKRYLLFKKSNWNHCGLSLKRFELRLLKDFNRNFNSGVN